MLLLLSGSGNPENQSMKGTAVFNTKIGDLWENTGRFSKTSYGKAPMSDHAEEGHWPISF